MQISHGDEDDAADDFYRHLIPFLAAIRAGSVDEDTVKCTGYVQLRYTFRKIG